MASPRSLPQTTPLPAELYLIGCGPGLDVQGVASPQTMGFKAWNLLRMARLELPVPPAFVLGTHYCLDPVARRHASERSLWNHGLQLLETASGLGWGNIRQPLLLSVRSGAPVSMPGMMETLLNIGLCDATVPGLLRRTGNPRLVWDAYRRLVAGYGEVVAGLPGRLFDDVATRLFGVREVADLDFAELRTLTRALLAAYADAAAHPFPQSPDEQLSGAIEAVLGSWESAKAREYRRLNQIPDAIGTSATVQAMIFGNGGGHSGSGVGFTRDPRSGAPVLWVDFLFNAQGEDVVSGRRSAPAHDELAQVLPMVWQELVQAARQLEHALQDMQDFEFTVQDSRLFLLQTRAGKRTPLATARITLDLMDEGVIDRQLARERVAGLDRDALAQSRIVTGAGAPLVALAHASAASNGIATGGIVFDETGAKARQQAQQAAILVRRDAETSDLSALESAGGLLTQRGARTSHAAVVARQLGKVCLVGCAAMQLDEAGHTLRFGTVTLHEGDVITLDGNSGAIYQGPVTTAIDYPEELLKRLDALAKEP